MTMQEKLNASTHPNISFLDGRNGGRAPRGQPGGPPLLAVATGPNGILGPT